MALTYEPPSNNPAELAALADLREHVDRDERLRFARDLFERGGGTTKEGRLNKRKLCSSTGLDPRQVEQMLADLRERFTALGWGLERGHLPNVSPGRAG